MTLIHKMSKILCFVFVSVGCANAIFDKSNITQGSIICGSQKIQMYGCVCIHQNQISAMSNSVKVMQSKLGKVKRAYLGMYKSFFATIGIYFKYKLKARRCSSKLGLVGDRQGNRILRTRLRANFRRLMRYKSIRKRLGRLKRKCRKFINALTDVEYSCNVFRNFSKQIQNGRVYKHTTRGCRKRILSDIELTENKRCKQLRGKKSQRLLKIQKLKLISKFKSVETAYRRTVANMRKIKLKIIIERSAIVTNKALSSSLVRCYNRYTNLANGVKLSLPRRRLSCLTMKKLYLRILLTIDATRVYICKLTRKGDSIGKCVAKTAKNTGNQVRNLNRHMTIIKKIAVSAWISMRQNYKIIRYTMWIKYYERIARNYGRSATANRARMAYFIKRATHLRHKVGLLKKSIAAKRQKRKHYSKVYAFSFKLYRIYKKKSAWYARMATYYMKRSQRSHGAIKMRLTRRASRCKRLAEYFRKKANNYYRRSQNPKRRNGRYMKRRKHNAQRLYKIYTQKSKRYAYMAVIYNRRSRKSQGAVKNRLARRAAWCTKMSKYFHKKASKYSSMVRNQRSRRKLKRHSDRKANQRRYYKKMAFYYQRKAERYLKESLSYNGRKRRAYRERARFFRRWARYYKRLSNRRSSQRRASSKIDYRRKYYYYLGRAAYYRRKARRATGDLKQRFQKKALRCQLLARSYMRIMIRSQSARKGRTTYYKQKAIYFSKLSKFYKAKANTSEGKMKAKCTKRGKYYAMMAKFYHDKARGKQ